MGERVFCCLGEYSVRRMTSVITVSPIRRGAIASGGGEQNNKKIKRVGGRRMLPLLL